MNEPRRNARACLGAALLSLALFACRGDRPVPPPPLVPPPVDPLPDPEPTPTPVPE